MRTTLQIDDDVLDAARSLAGSENKSIGQVISELARRGLRPDLQAGEVDGFPVFRVPEDCRPLTPERVKTLESEP